MNHNSPSRLMELKLKKDLAEEEGEEEANICDEQKDRKPLLSDAIYEILTRVSLGTLLRGCRWVCKDWRKLICDTNFQLIHSQRTPIASGYFFQSYSSSGALINFIPVVDHQYSQQVPSPSLDFLTTKNIHIRGASSCGSLLCCVKQPRRSKNPTYYICKPATREWRRIPNPRTRFSKDRIVVLNQSHPTLHFKILRFSTPRFRHGYHCEMFNSNNWAWKRLEDIKLPDCITLDRGCNILVNGGLHWLTNDHRIFVFYIDQENWTTIELPHEIEDKFRGSKTITHCDGKIGVFYSTLEWMELWVLENYCTTKPAWKKKYHNDLTSVSDHERGYASPVLLHSTNIVLMTNDHEIMWYNCNDDTYTTAMKIPAESYAYDVFAFQSRFYYL